MINSWNRRFRRLLHRNRHWEYHIWISHAQIPPGAKFHRRASYRKPGNRKYLRISGFRRNLYLSSPVHGILHSGVFELEKFKYDILCVDFDARIVEIATVSWIFGLYATNFRPLLPMKMYDRASRNSWIPNHYIFYFILPLFLTSVSKTIDLLRRFYSNAGRVTSRRDVGRTEPGSRCDVTRPLLE